MSLLSLFDFESNFENPGDLLTDLFSNRNCLVIILENEDIEEPIPAKFLALDELHLERHWNDFTEFHKLYERFDQIEIHCFGRGHLELDNDFGQKGKKSDATFFVLAEVVINEEVEDFSA